VTPPAPALALVTDNKLAGLGTGAHDCIIVCRNSQAVEVRATPLRLTRHVVVFEVYNPYSILQLSEVLSEFKIILNERLVYSGRAVVSNLLNTGILLVCEATLEESWLDVDLFAPINQRQRLQGEFAEFIREWQKIHQVKPEFKVAVADLLTLMVDLRRWMEQVELGVRSQPSVNRVALEREVIQQLQEPVFPALLPLFERFEDTAGGVDEDLRPAHSTYVKKQLHPVVLCAPFFYRSFRKPLGYAGDYEMVNMMLRDPVEGGSMFAKLLNMFFLSTPPVVAHRNRIARLRYVLQAETARVASLNRPIRILNLGCGPAQEVQDFMAQDALSDRAQFVLMDFNDETLAHTGKVLHEVRARFQRRTHLQMVKKSVHQLLKESVRPPPELEAGAYDLVYCAGLFDYLSDRICQRLMNAFYDLLAPGGLLVATNVNSANPSRHWMEYVVEWHLVYRDPRLFATLVPDRAPAGSWNIRTEATGVNLFLEVRRPGP
jgi:extracellular factor (EF) 3-hydroxypalmitic acid methyl ester biosynthesis protein